MLPFDKLNRIGYEYRWHETFQDLPTPNKLVFDTYAGFATWINDIRARLVVASQHDYFDHGGNNSPVATLQLAVYEARKANMGFATQYDLAQAALRDVDLSYPRLRAVA